MAAITNGVCTKVSGHRTLLCVFSRMVGVSLFGDARHDPYAVAGHRCRPTHTRRPLSHSRCMVVGSCAGSSIDWALGSTLSVAPQDRAANSTSPLQLIRPRNTRSPALAPSTCPPPNPSHSSATHALSPLSPRTPTRPPPRRAAVLVPVPLFHAHVLVRIFTFLKPAREPVPVRDFTQPLEVNSSTLATVVSIFPYFHIMADVHASKRKRGRPPAPAAATTDPLPKNPRGRHVWKCQVCLQTSASNKDRSQCTARQPPPLPVDRNRPCT